MHTDDTEPGPDRAAPKRPYTKPTIQVEGNVEDLTLKDLGFSDAFLFRGGGPGGGVNGESSFNAS